MEESNTHVRDCEKILYNGKIERVTGCTPSALTDLVWL